MPGRIQRCNTARRETVERAAADSYDLLCVRIGKASFHLRKESRVLILRPHLPPKLIDLVITDRNRTLVGTDIDRAVHAKRDRNRLARLRRGGRPTLNRADLTGTKRSAATRK